MMQPPSPANSHQAVAMLCLQAQQVAGLPDAAEGRRIQLSTTSTPATSAAAAVAVCRAGVADFHRQVLLLHCAPISSIDAVAVTVTMAAATCSEQRRVIATVTLDLAEQLRRRPCASPSALSFVLGLGGGGGTTTAAAATAAAGAVLSLILHHRLLATTTRTGCSSLLRSCLGLPLIPLTGCCPPVLRTTTKRNRQHDHQGPAEAADDDDGGDGDGDSSSSGFITIEKGTISRRRPPSDYLLTTTDDEEVDGKRPPGLPTTTTAAWCWSLEDDTKVENEFLAMLMLEDDDDDDDFDLDALIKDAEADLPTIWTSHADD